TSRSACGSARPPSRTFRRFRSWCVVTWWPTASRRSPPSTSYWGRSIGEGVVAGALRPHRRARGALPDAQGRAPSRALVGPARARLDLPRGRGGGRGPARTRSGRRRGRPLLLLPLPPRAARHRRHRRLRQRHLPGERRRAGAVGALRAARHQARRDDQGRPLHGAPPGVPRGLPSGAGGAGRSRVPRTDPFGRGADRMSAAYEPVLLRRLGVERAQDIDVYERSGGYGALRKAMGMSPQAVTDEVMASNLRGRGGAGFPTGRKWSFIPKDAPVKYLAVNADESEPGTFNNRVFIDADPHALIEGILICCWAVGIAAAYIYIRGENVRGARLLNRAVAQAREKGYVGR